MKPRALRCAARSTGSRGSYMNDVTSSGLRSRCALRARSALAVDARAAGGRGACPVSEKVVKARGSASGWLFVKRTASSSTCWRRHGVAAVTVATNRRFQTAALQAECQVLDASRRPRLAARGRRHTGSSLSAHRPQRTEGVPLKPAAAVKHEALRGDVPATAAHAEVAHTRLRRLRTTQLQNSQHPASTHRQRGLGRICKQGRAQSQPGGAT